MNYNRTTADAAARWGVTERTIRNWCKRGYLPAVKMGGVWRLADLPSLQPPPPAQPTTAEQGGEQPTDPISFA